LSWQNDSVLSSPTRCPRHQTVISGSYALKRTKINPNKVFVSISPSIRTIDRPVCLSIAVKQPGSQYWCPVHSHGTVGRTQCHLSCIAPSLSANVMHRPRWASRRESKVHCDSVALIDLPDWLFLLTTITPCVAGYAHVPLCLSPRSSARGLYALHLTGEYDTDRQMPR
jgi:hypothetical protein